MIIRKTSIDYFCIDCGKKVSTSSGLYGDKRCRSCAGKERAKKYKGKNSPNWQGGKDSKIYYCRVCKKNKISYWTNFKGKRRCRVCYGLACRGKRGTTGNKFCKHHLDLNTENNKKCNIYIMTNSKHQLFHRIAYHYILEKFGIKEILKYKKWFNKKYGDKIND